MRKLSWKMAVMVYKNRKLCFRGILLTKTPSDQKSKILPESRKWAFRLRVPSLSKPKIESPLRSQSEIVFSRRAPHQNTLRPKVENPTWKSKVGVPPRASVILKRRTCPCASANSVSIFLGVARWDFVVLQTKHAIDLRKVAFPSFWALEAPVVLQIRTRHWYSESGFSIFLGARGSCRPAKYVEHAIDLQKVAFPSFWALEAHCMSSCKVEHAIGLRKMAFPSFWALEAHVVLQRRTCHWSSTIGVSIFLQAATRCESKPCASFVTRKALENGLHCTPASCVYIKQTRC